MNDTERTLSDLLRAALTQSTEPYRQIARDTGLHHGSLLRFMRGRQSLRLDLADRLADHFGIESRPMRRRDGA